MVTKSPNWRLFPFEMAELTPCHVNRAYDPNLPLKRLVLGSHPPSMGKNVTTFGGPLRAILRKSLTARIC